MDDVGARADMLSLLIFSLDDDSLAATQYSAQFIYRFLYSALNASSISRRLGQGSFSVC